MMEISSELKQKVINACNANKSHLSAFVRDRHFEHQFIILPIVIDGVYDMIRYNVDKKQFDQIEIQVAVGDVSMLDWNEDIGYSSHTESVVIPLSIGIEQ